MRREGDTDYLVMELVEGETLKVVASAGMVRPQDMTGFGDDTLSSYHRCCWQL